MQTLTVDDDVRSPLDRGTGQPEYITKTTNGPQQRKQILIKSWFLTFTVWYASFASGGAVTIFGPALIDLQYIYGTTIHVSVLFTAVGGGYFVGSLVGGILIDKLAWRFHFVISTLGLSLTFLILPWLPVFWLFACVCFLMSIFQGFIDTAGTVVMHRLWNQSRHHNSVLHAIQLSWCIGATVSPFILEPFLAKNSPPEQYANSSQISSNASYMMSQISSNQISSNASYRISPVNTSTGISNRTSNNYTESNVQLGICAFGCVVAVSAVLSCTVCIFDKCPIRFKKNTEVTDRSFEQCQTKTNRGVVLCFVCTAIFLQVTIEFSIGSLLTTFVFAASKLEPSTGSFLTSIFWGAFGLSRLCGVFLSKILSSTKQLNILLVGENITIIILVLSVQTHDAIAWIFFPMLGFCSGACVPSFVCVAAQYIGINGVDRHVFCVSWNHGDALFNGLSDRYCRTNGLILRDMLCRTYRIFHVCCS